MTTNIPFRKILGLNQQTYQRLRTALSLNLRRQIFVAVCDDLVLRDRLAAQLQTDISRVASEEVDAMGQAIIRSNGRSSGQSYPPLVSLQLSLDDPNPLIQIAQWLTESPPPIIRGQRAPLPAFQILGVEHLTRQSPGIQRLFFTHLQTIERNLPLLDFSLLIWTTEPWFYALPQSAPGFWRCRTGVFEFLGDPTPLTITVPERFGAQSSQQTTTTPLREEDLTPPREYPSQPSKQPAEKPLPQHQREEGLSDIQQPTPTPTDGDWANNPWATLADDLFQPYEPDEELTETQAQVPEPDTTPSATDILNLGEDQVTSSLITPTEDSSDIANVTDATDSLDVADSTNAADSSDIADITATEPDALDAADTSTSITPLQLPLEILAAHEQAFSLYQYIQHLHQQAVHPAHLAEAYRQLGNFFRDRIEQGEVIPENLVVAIQAYEQVLACLSEASPLWVDVLNDLGNLYWMTSRTAADTGQALLLLQQSIQVYRLALTKVDPETDAQTYPMLYNNLGAAYADLARHHDSVQNLELSIQSYRQALRYRQPDSDPLRYASTQNNLGTTYWNLAQYKDPQANLKLAVNAYSEALRYYNPEQEPLNHAMIQNNLGTAYWNLSQQERPEEWLALAVNAYQQALNYRTLEDSPAAHAATQNNLGTAFWHVANHTEDARERSSHLKQAIIAYEAALKAAEYLKQQTGVAALNFDLFATQNNLGLAHYQLATDSMNPLSADAQTHHLQAALDHHVQALQGWENQSNLRQTALNCIIQTARAAFNQLGLPGQTMALSRIPGNLLSEVLPKL